MTETIGSREKHEEPSSISRYLAQKHETLKNDYKTPDGKFMESCGLLALDAAKALIDDGKMPYTVAFLGKETPNPYVRTNAWLVPQQFGGRVSWGAHVVCVCDGFVYDPMVGVPISLETYAQDVFGTKEVKMEILDTEEETARLVERRRASKKISTDSPERNIQ